MRKRMISALLALSLCAGVPTAFAADDTFDATLTVEQSGNTITVTVPDNQAVYEGADTTLTIPCGAGWQSATVVHTGGNKQTVAVENETVTFAVLQGGQYTVTLSTESVNPGTGGNTGGNTGGSRPSKPGKPTGQPAEQPDEQPTEIPVAPAFPDVSSDKWFYEAVTFVCENGMMTGLPDGRFDPHGELSRAMIAQILYNMEGRPSVSGSAFTDVPAGAWYADAVNWAAAQGLIFGDGAGHYGAGTPITREQLVSVLYRYAQATGRDVSVGADTNILSYSDALTISEYAIPAFQWACGAGLITGANGKLSPRATASRAEIAQILMQFVK